MRKSIKKLGKDVPFVSEHITESEQKRIHKYLPKCKTEDEVKELFDSDQELPVEIDYSALLQGMTVEVQAMKEYNKYQNREPIVVNNYVHPAEAKVDVNIPETKINNVMPEQKAPDVKIDNHVTVPDKRRGEKEIIEAIKKIADG